MSVWQSIHRMTHPLLGVAGLWFQHQPKSLWLTETELTGFWAALMAGYPLHGYWRLHQRRMARQYDSVIQSSQTLLAILNRNAAFLRTNRVNSCCFSAHHTRQPPEVMTRTVASLIQENIEARQMLLKIIAPYFRALSCTRYGLGREFIRHYLGLLMTDDAFTHVAQYEAMVDDGRFDDLHQAILKAEATQSIAFSAHALMHQYLQQIHAVRSRSG